MKIIKLFFFIIAAILLSLVSQVPVYLGITSFNGNSLLKLSIAVVAFLIILGLLCFIRVKCFPDIPTHKKTPLLTIIVWTILAFLLVIAVKSMLQLLGFSMESGNGNNEDILSQMASQNMWVMMAGLHVIGPILEELVFRGMLLEGLIRLNPNKHYFNLFLSSFLFAYAHIYTFSISLLDYFVCGLLYGVLYYKSRALRDSILAHILTNVLITLFLLIAKLLV